MNLIQCCNRVIRIQCSHPVDQETRLLQPFAAAHLLRAEILIILHHLDGDGLQFLASGPLGIGLRLERAYSDRYRNVAPAAGQMNAAEIPAGVHLRPVQKIVDLDTSGGVKIPAPDVFCRGHEEIAVQFDPDIGISPAASRETEIVIRHPAVPVGLRRQNGLYLFYFRQVFDRRFPVR